MVELIHRILKWHLFTRPEETTGAWQTIKWWELRRIPFNLIVGIIGLISMTVVLLLASELTEDTADGSPLLFGFGIIFYGLGANICYTGGWITELLAKAIWEDRIGSLPQISFFFGVFFSILLTIAPGVFLSGLIVISYLLGLVSSP